MNRGQCLLRRLSGCAAAALLGLTAILTIASPASAHHAEVSGTASCDTVAGQWVITWTVRNSQDNKDATLNGVAASPDTAIDGISIGSVVPKRLPETHNGELTGVQRVPGSTTTASLTVTPDWPSFDEEGKTYTGTVTPSGSCQPAPKCVDAADAHFEHTFDGPKGAATVSLVGDLPLCEGQSQDFTLVSYFTPSPKFAVPQYLNDSDTGRIDRERRTIELNVDLPDCYTQVDLFFGGKDGIINPLDGTKLYGNRLLGSRGAPGNRSRGPRGGWTGGARSCTQPAAEFVPSCDGKVDVHLTNTGKYTAPFVVVGERGFKATASVAPGKSETVRVPAKSAGAITVTSEGSEVASGRWTRPKTCALPTLVAGTTCTDLTLTVRNPAGNLPVNAVVEYGTQFRKLTVAAGGSQKVTLPLSTAESATVTFEGLNLELEATPAKPRDCGGGGGGLPVTGAAVGGWLAAAAVLVSTGGGLFLLARRRRIRFTA